MNDVTEKYEEQNLVRLPIDAVEYAESSRRAAEPRAGMARMPWRRNPADCGGGAADCAAPLAQRHRVYYNGWSGARRHRGSREPRHRQNKARVVRASI
jgi:hypothetical protein